MGKKKEEEDDDDVSDVDVCYAYSTLFTAELLRQWCVHAERSMRPGTLVLTPTRPLDHASFARDCQASGSITRPHARMRRWSAERMKPRGGSLRARKR